MTFVVFVLMTLAGGPANPHVLLAFGASCRPYFLAGEYWRAVMPMFLHLSAVHLLLNLYALCLFGPELERLRGCGTFGLIYISAGTAGSVGSMLMSRGSEQARPARSWEFAGLLSSRAANCQGCSRKDSTRCSEDHLF